MKYYVYIIESEVDGRYYYGQSSDPEKRLHEHNTGRSGYTSKYVPWNLKALKEFPTRSLALKTERMLKNLHSKQRVEDFVVRHGFQKVIGPEK